MITIQLLKNKSFLSVFALLANMMTCDAQQKIVYTHIGISDKPICTIEILCNKKEDILNHCKRTFCVDKATFQLLKRHIKNSEIHIPTVETTEYSYGTFKVLLLEHSKTHERIMNREESITFFGNQLPLLRSDVKLHNEIKVLLDRLRIQQNGAAQKRSEQPQRNPNQQDCLQQNGAE